MFEVGTDGLRHNSAAVSNRTRGRRSLRRRPRVSARPAKGVRPHPPRLAAGDPLIHPKILKLARQMALGRLKPKDLTKLFPQQPPLTSRELIPFLQSPDLPTLVRVL